MADEGLLESLSTSIGSQFNLGLARALRAKVLLMVEGDDLAILRRLATTLGAQRVAREDGVAVVQLRGFSGSAHIQAFQWIQDELLENSVPCFVILDRDYRSDDEVAAIERRLRDLKVSGHVWKRKELESYLLSPSAIARLSGAPEDFVLEASNELAAGLEASIFSRMQEERIRERLGPKADRVRIATEFKTEFDARWEDVEWRLTVAPPKEIIHGLNARLQAGRFKTISSERLAETLVRGEVPLEMAQVLRRIDEAAGRAGA